MFQDIVFTKPVMLALEEKGIIGEFKEYWRNMIKKFHRDYYADTISITARVETIGEF